MAREKVKRVKGEPKKMMAAMSVKKVKPPAQKYLVCIWWTCSTDFIIKIRLNPDYKQ